MNEKLELAVLLGNNKEKLELALEFTKDQSKKVVKDFWTRPNKLLFSDFEEPSRHRKDEVVKITGEDIAEKMLKYNNFPSSEILLVAKYLFEYNRWSYSLGTVLAEKLHKYPVAEEYVYKQMSEQLNNLKNHQELIGKLRRSNSKFFKYKDLFFTKIKQTKGLKTLQSMTALVLNFVSKDEETKIYPLLETLVKSQISKLSTKELLNYHKNQRFSNYYLFTDGVSFLDTVIHKLVKEELPKREHVNSSKQSQLIRKMSIHAGEKLSLKEAQFLANKIKNK
jgi:hypothetical protein